MTIDTSVELDLDRQQQAKEYARLRRRLSLLSMGIGVVGILILLFTNLGIWIADKLQFLSWQPIPGWFPVQILVYVLILFLGFEIITFPITYYRGFVIVSAPKPQNSERGKVLPHRYGLSTMSLRGWLADLFKGLEIGRAHV